MNRRAFVIACAAASGCTNNKIFGRRVPLLSRKTPSDSPTYNGYSKLILDFHRDNPRLYIDFFHNNNLGADGNYDAAYELNFTKRTATLIDSTPPFASHFSQPPEVESFDDRYVVRYGPMSCSIFAKNGTEMAGFRTAIYQLSDKLSVRMKLIESVHQLTLAADYLKR